MLSLFRYPARAKTIEAQDKVLHTQNLALTMAIMSQVHVSIAQVAQAKKETSTAKLYHDTQSQISEQTRLGWRIGPAERTGQCCASESIRYQLNCDTMPWSQNYKSPGPCSWPPLEKMCCPTI